MIDLVNETFTEIMYYLLDREDDRHKVLYGDHFVFDILNRLNDIFLANDSDSDEEN